MIRRWPASSTTTPSLKGYSVETTFRHAGFAQAVVSVVFSCGRAMLCALCGGRGLDTLSSSLPIERRTFFLQELIRGRRAGRFLPLRLVRQCVRPCQHPLPALIELRKNPLGLRARDVSRRYVGVHLLYGRLNGVQVFP